MNAIESQNRREVVIVGAGISGLAAAWYLTHSGRPLKVTVIEASSRVGGVLETIRDGDYLIERSADNFATLVPDALEFCKSTGFDSELISPNQQGRQAFVLNRGQILPIPAGFSLMQPTRVASILSTRTLSWSGKLRLLGEYFVPKRASDEDESLQDYALRRLGSEAFENLVEPIVSGIFTADPARLSMQATLPQFVAMEKKHGGLIRGHLAARRDDASAAAKRASGARYDQFLAPRLGMNQWLDHIQQMLPQGCIQLSTSVKSCRRTPSADSQLLSGSPAESKFVIETSRGSLNCDALIVATPTGPASKILQSEFSEIANALSEISYASSAVLAVVLDRDEIKGRIDGFGLIVPRVEKRRALAISYTSNKYPGRVPAGQILLRVFLGGALQSEVLELDDARLIEIGLQEVREILNWQGSSPKWQALVRWTNAMPQYHVGHLLRMNRLQQLIDTVPNLYLCGAGYSGVGIPQCVRSGKLAASQLLDKFASN